MIRKIAKRLSPTYLRFYSFLRKAKRTPRYTRTSVSFPGYKLEVADMMSFAWQYWEIILKECYVFKASTDTPLIIDCGANIGLSSLYFSKLYPGARIKAIEADPAIAAICEKNIVANHATNIELVSKAAWTKNGFIYFSTEGSDGGRIDDATRASQVACMDFAEYLQPFESIDFLKIDIEGAETTILPHIQLQLRKVKYLFIEYHSPTQSKQELGELLQLLQQKNFRYYIEDLKKTDKPFLAAANHASNDHFDLQLNIYAVNIQL